MVEVGNIPSKNQHTEFRMNVKTMLDKKDLTIKFILATGAGGQNVNKRKTGVRIVHKPTGIMVKCTTHRTQGMNKKAALERLEEKLAKLNHVDKPRIKTTEVIRTYNKKRNEVHDKRTGNIKPYEDVLNGDIDF